LAAILLLALIFNGCSKTTPTTGETNEETAAKATTEEVTEESTAQPEEVADPTEVKFDPPITISIVRSVTTVETVKFDDVNLSYDENVWINMIHDKYGIDVEYLWYADASQYDTKFNLMMSSGTFPDIFQVTSVKDLRLLVENDQLADLTGAYAACADDSAVKYYSSEVQDIYFDIASQDGKLYGIPHMPTGPGGCQMIILRKDWLDALEMDEPETMADFVEVAKAFATQDPDGNGEDDTVGMYVPADPLFGESMQAFYNGYHVYPGIYAEGEDGMLSAGAQMAGMKDALSSLQDMYATGAISKEYATMDDNRVKELIANGKLGIWFGTFISPLLYLQGCMHNDETADWKVYPVLSNDGDKAYSQAPGGVAGWFVASKDCEHPEAVLTLMDASLWHPSKSDREAFQEWYDTYSETPNGDQVAHFSPLQVGVDFMDSEGVLLQLKQYQAYFRGEMTMDEINPDIVNIVENGEKYKAGDISNWWWDMVFRPGGTMQTLKEYNDTDMIMYNQFAGYLQDTTAQSLSIAKDILVQVVTKILMGEDVSAYDAALEQWEAAGGAAAVAEVNEWYSQFK
jgi:putative aldouronate transport system substrate-binding protein